MRFRTYQEATAFVKALLAEKEKGSREFMTAKLDTVPQWNPAGKTPPPALDGSRVTAVYLAYKKPTERQKREAQGAKLAGVDLQLIEGRLVDVRRVGSDGTTQLLLTNGLRNADGSIPFRGPNVDKGILCALSINEGLGETVQEIIARVPAELKASLEQLKNGQAKLDVPAMDLAAVVARNIRTQVPPAQLPPQQEQGPDEDRVKLR